MFFRSERQFKYIKEFLCNVIFLLLIATVILLFLPFENIKPNRWMIGMNTKENKGNAIHIYTCTNTYIGRGCRISVKT